MSTTPSKPPVGVVIVNWNLKDSLRETLASFRQVNYPGLQIVVSDNASTDGSIEMVRSEFPEVHLLTREKGVGYAKGASLGMAFLADKTKYIFSTTNDVLVDPEMITALVDYAEAHPDAGVLGCKIFYHNHGDLLWSAGGRMHPLFAHSYHFGWNRHDGPRYNQVRDCDYVTGCGFLLRTEVARKLNFFNSDLVFYSEDADFCYRVRGQGYRIVYVPQARMWHKTATTLAKNRPMQLYYSTRNNLYLTQQYRVGWYPLSLWVNLWVVCPAKMVLFGLFTRKNALGIWRGIQHWRQNRYGWGDENWFR
ncbi:MAG: glycosyltransferase family 2 protein [Verrucomicrobiota bacterium]